MPLISTSSYAPPTVFTNGHLQTILPALFRTVDGVNYERERIATPDDDFLDLDWSRVNATPSAKRVAILLHGLEGSSESVYIRGMAKALNRAGWDALAWNYRGCGGEPNKKLRAYHSGATDDVETVVAYVASLRRYQTVALIGFSLGGNLTLKYVGEKSANINSLIKAAVAFSVPLDLASSSRRISKQVVYNQRFLSSLRKKIRIKAAQFPDKIDLKKLENLKTLWQFDDAFTAPIHGFQGAADYYEKCSSKQFLKTISIPTLITSALNDPFLPQDCFPFDEIAPLKNVFFETPKFGGHIGFMDKQGDCWSEERAIDFLNETV
jgi:uncharacterized protein